MFLPKEIAKWKNEHKTCIVCGNQCEFHHYGFWTAPFTNRLKEFNIRCKMCYQYNATIGLRPKPFKSLRMTNEYFKSLRMTNEYFFYDDCNGKVNLIIYSMYHKSNPINVGGFDFINASLDELLNKIKMIQLLQ